MWPAGAPIVHMSDVARARACAGKLAYATVDTWTVVVAHAEFSVLAESPRWTARLQSGTDIDLYEFTTEVQHSDGEENGLDRTIQLRLLDVNDRAAVALSLFAQKYRDQALTSSTPAADNHQLRARLLSTA